MTLQLGVIGYPVSQSISPVFQQAALDRCGLDIGYSRWETTPEALPERIASLRLDGVLGANVTVPHKQAVMPLLDGLDATASAIGAVNTIVKRDGRLTGYNTDCSGFADALREDGGFELKGTRALVIGAGGAARAVVYALLTSGAEFVGLAARSSARARALRQDFSGLAQQAGIRVFVEEWESEQLALAVPTYDLIINATPLGMAHGPAGEHSPLKDIDITHEAFVYDLVYNPRETPLLRQARLAGCRTLDGLPMLVRQGAAAFRLWTGLEPPIAEMMAAAEAALPRKGRG